MQPPIKNCKWISYPIGDVTQYFGENKKLYKQSMGWEGGHNGADLVRPHGEHMFAVEDGVICDLKDSADGYGKHIRILSTVGLGRYREWTYGHMHAIGVKLGQKVKAGQFVGLMGNTGFVVSGDTPYWGTNPYAGTHLHLNVREMVKDANGWQYPYKESPKVRCKNYDNGTKGGIDPIPFFFTAPKARAMRDLAEKKKSALLYSFAEVLQKINT
jgi:murein DD-endopeptidase MepM/ murein hydrolase activator NlpD